MLRSFLFIFFCFLSVWSKIYGKSTAVSLYLDYANLLITKIFGGICAAVYMINTGCATLCDSGWRIY